MAKTGLVPSSRNQIGAIPSVVGGNSFGLPSATPKSTIPGTNFQYDLAGGTVNPVASKQAYRTLQFVPSLIGLTPEETGIFQYRGNVLAFMATSLGNDALVFVKFDDENADPIAMRPGTTITGLTFDTLIFTSGLLGSQQTCYFMVAYDPDNQPTTAS